MPNCKQITWNNLQKEEKVINPTYDVQNVLRHTELVFVLQLVTTIINAIVVLGPMTSIHIPSKELDHPRHMARSYNRQTKYANS